MKKLILFLALLLSLNTSSVRAAETIELPAQYGIAVDLRTGKILYEKDADQVVPVANLSRLLTIYLVYQAVEEGRVDWKDKVTISDYAYNLTYESEIPNIPLENREYTLQDLTKASIISASTSASIALAEHVSGSEEAFVKDMRQLLKSWDLTDRRIVNSSGVNNIFLGDQRLPKTKATEENTLSARDLAIISQKLVTDFPDVLEFTEATRGNFADTHIYTYNYLLENMPYARPYAYGLVTGSSEKAGSSLISLSYENGMQVLAVFLNVDDAQQDPLLRFQVANTFLNDIADNFHLQKVLTVGRSVNDTPAPILDGKTDQVLAVAQDDFYVVTTPDTANNISIKTVFPEKTNFAPIEEGQVVGQVVFDDKELIGQGYLGKQPSMNLVADDQVERANIFQVIWNAFVRYVIEYL